MDNVHIINRHYEKIKLDLYKAKVQQKAILDSKYNSQEGSFIKNDDTIGFNSFII